MQDIISHGTKHSIDELPDRFAQSIGAPEGTVFVKEAVNALDIWSRILKNSKQFLYLISPIVVTYYMEMIFAHVQENASANEYTFSYLIPKGAGLGQEYDRLRKKYGVYQLMSKGIIQSHRGEKVKLSMILNEKEAAIAFPANASGSVQEFSTFYGETREFHQWCVEYFQDRIRNSEKLDSEKYKWPG